MGKLNILNHGGDIMISVWTDSIKLPNFDTLTHDIKTKVLIIGGGLAGILCAFRLQEKGVDYVLVEADKICSGITKNTTAKITSQHGLVYHKIYKEFGLKQADMYLKANQAALEQYRNMCKRIECDFQTKDNYVYSLTSKKKLEQELEVLHRIGFGAELTEKLPLPFDTVGAVRFPDQAQFNPLKFVAAITKDLHIYEHTKVKELVKNKAITEYGSVKADRIIVTTHFPFLNKHGSYFLKMYQQRSYVLALENAQEVHGMYVDEAKNGLSFRNYENLLLLGGGGHRTGKQGGDWHELERFANEHYPSSHEMYRWATQDCMTLDSIPYIGQYSKRLPGMFVATGFNKWGMTSSMVAANILTDLVTGKQNDYAAVFSPSRTMLRPQLAVNGIESTLNLCTPTKKRCPHLGCALKWNPVEHSWDCPCHGSRFTKDGKLIDNPATGDLKK